MCVNTHDETVFRDRGNGSDQILIWLKYSSHYTTATKEVYECTDLMWSRFKTLQTEHSEE